MDNTEVTQFINDRKEQQLTLPLDPVTEEILKQFMRRNSGLFESSSIGDYKLIYGTTAPEGWLACDGTAVSRSVYSNLYALIGTTFGTGDGSTTFNLPNLKGRVPVMYDSTQTEFDNVGEAGGAKTHTLTEAELPQHRHTISPGNAPGGITSGSAGNINLAGDFSGYAGSDQPHNNLQPYLVAGIWVIKY